MKLETGTIYFGENALGVAKEGAPRGRDTDSAAVALEKCDTVEFLDARDAAAQGRLGDRQCAGGFAEVLVVRRGGKVAKAFYIHGTANQQS
jgi:hypothetical protein